MFGLSSFVSCTIAPDLKFVPVSEVMVIVDPALPSSGTIFLKVGFPVTLVVGVVVVVVVLPVVDVVTVVLVVATVVGLRITIEEGGLLVIFIVLVFSKTDRVTVSEFELVRYPQLPSALA
jgi:hypothetical protein